MQKIRISDLEVFAYHGVLPAEKKDGQIFLVSAELTFGGATAKDELTATVNYADACKKITAFMTEKPYNLIETVADALCKMLLKIYPQIISAAVEVKKPNAPMDFKFEHVSAVSERERHTAYIALGSNLGEREAFLEDALFAMDDHPACRVEKVSAFLNTKAYGKTDQPDFLNAVCQIETLLEPLELLAVLQEIEEKAGRERGERWGPRTLDLDILFYDDLILHKEDLIIPHPDFHNRRFALELFCEVAPDYVHPVLKKAVKEILARCD